MQHLVKSHKPEDTGEEALEQPQSSGGATPHHWHSTGTHLHSDWTRMDDGFKLPRSVQMDKSEGRKWREEGGRRGGWGRGALGQRMVCVDIIHINRERITVTVVTNLITITIIITIIIATTTTIATF